MRKVWEFSHFCDDQTSKWFSIFNLKDHATTKLEVPYKTVFHFDSAQIENHIYFTGGGLPDKNQKEVFFQTAMEVIINKDDECTKKLSNMNVARADHTLVAVGDKFLFAIGGCNTKAEIPACERYDIAQNKWYTCASLNEKKIWVSVCVFDLRYLYAFGGSTNLKPKESQLIEYLDIEDDKAKLWTKVELGAGKDLWKRCFFSGCQQVAPDCIMIFGGLVNSAEFDDTFYFSPKHKSIINGPKLLKKDAFYRSKLGINGKEIVIVGNSDGDLHTYNTVDKKWSLILKSTWDPESGFNIKSQTC